MKSHKGGGTLLSLNHSSFKEISLNTGTSPSTSPFRYHSTDANGSSKYYGLKINPQRSAPQSIHPFWHIHIHTHILDSCCHRYCDPSWRDVDPILSVNTLEQLRDLANRVLHSDFYKGWYLILSGLSLICFTLNILQTW